MGFCNSVYSAGDIVIKNKMETSGILNTKAFQKTGTDVVDLLPEKGLPTEDKERLIVLGRGVAELAHQLNNSFDGIRRFLSLSLACADDKEKTTHYVLNAKVALERVCIMAESLLNFARNERTAYRGPQILHHMLEDVLHLYEDKLKARGVQLVTHKEQNNNLFVPVDFYHVFLNLIKNAIEAMPLGGVLRVLAHREDGHVKVTISDTGVGIPEHLRGKLFRPFFTTKGKNGTGLGLALSKEIVERYGGAICCESKLGEGATFIVTVPHDRVAEMNE